MHVGIYFLFCYVVCRCSELTRKDKLCENVRRMQHAKVSRHWCTVCVNGLSAFWLVRWRNILQLNDCTF